MGLLPLLRSRSRLWLLPSVNTPCGLEDLFWLPCPLSKVCGSRRRNTTSLARRLSTTSASKEIYGNIRYSGCRRGGYCDCQKKVLPIHYPLADWIFQKIQSPWRVDCLGIS